MTYRIETQTRSQKAVIHSVEIEDMVEAFALKVAMENTLYRGQWISFYMGGELIESKVAGRNHGMGRSIREYLELGFTHEEAYDIVEYGAALPRRIPNWEGLEKEAKRLHRKAYGRDK